MKRGIPRTNKNYQAYFFRNLQMTAFCLLSLVNDESGWKTPVKNMELILPGGKNSRSSGQSTLQSRLSCICISWFGVESRSVHFIQCPFQPFKCHRRMEGNHNIWCFHLNMNWFPSQGESASKAETDFPNWLRPRGGDWWTALESHQKVSQDLFKTFML